MLLQNSKELWRPTNRRKSTQRAGDKVSNKDGAPSSEDVLAAEAAGMHHLLKQMDANQKMTLAEVKR